MALIAQDILTSAYGYSAKTQPGRSINEAQEGRRIVQRSLQGLFAVAARVNPEYYGVDVDVDFDIAANGWLRPAVAEAVYRIERTDFGDEVIVVPRFDRQADVARPALYRRGKVYLSAGNPLDPVNETLRFCCSKVPDALAAIADPVDALYPDHFAALLELEVAMYIALKDGRMDEVAALRPQRDEWAALYIAHLEHETSNEVRRTGTLRTFQTPQLLAMLAGGRAA